MILVIISLPLDIAADGSLRIILLVEDVPTDLLEEFGLTDFLELLKRSCELEKRAFNIFVLYINFL